MLYFLKHFVERRLVYREKKEHFNINSLTEWINSNQHPLVMKFDPVSSNIIFSRKFPALVIFRFEDSQEKGFYDTYLMEVAKKYKGKIIAATSDFEDDYEKKLGELIEINQADFPCAYILDTRFIPDVKKYKLEGEITEESLSELVEKWLKSEVVETLKSEEIPSESILPLIEVVGKNFNNIVLDEGKDVLLMVYSLDCYKCTKFEKDYFEMAQKLSHNQNLILAKMDGTKNSSPGLVIFDYPTFIIYPGNNKQNPHRYAGDIDSEYLIDFVEKYSYYPVYKNKDDL